MCVFCAYVTMVEVREKLQELVFSFYHVGPGDRTQSISFDSKYLYLSRLDGFLIISLLFLPKLQSFIQGGRTLTINFISM